MARASGAHRVSGGRNYLRVAGSRGNNATGAGSGSSGAVAPANTVAPVVSGTVNVGQTLTTTNGTWTGSPTAYTYQWQRAGANISSATNSTYVLTTADIESAIRCVVTATNTVASVAANSNALAWTAFVNDTFTDVDATAITSHTGETGATWTTYTQISGSTSMKIVNNRAYTATGGETNAAYASGSPPGADYSVFGIVVPKSLIGSSNICICGRLNTGANTLYRLILDTGQLFLRKTVAGTGTTLGTPYSITPNIDQSYQLELRMTGTTLEGYLDGVLRTSATDASISAAGKVGLTINLGGSSTTGFHMDRLWATG